MMRVLLKDGRYAELANGVCVSLEALEAGVTCDDGGAHLLGHYTAAELRGFTVAPVPEPRGEAGSRGPDAGGASVSSFG